MDGREFRSAITRPPVPDNEKTGRQRREDRLPGGVYVLGFSLFAMGTAEFLLAGVLPVVADDLSVTVSSAGFLITTFALGVVVGGPPFAVLSRRWPRRSSLVVAQLLFAGSLCVGLVGGYGMLMATRFVAGVAYAGFFAVASATAVSMVPASRTARASGVVVSGLSLAMVVGGPAGTVLSQSLSWRAGFWAVVVHTLLGAAACWAVIPSPSLRPDGSPRVQVGREIAVLRRPRLWWLYVIIILSTGSYMITFNYLSAMLTASTRIAGGWIPAILALFGVGAFLGLSVGGRIADRRPHLALGAGVLGITLATLALVVALPRLGAVLPIVLALGVASFLLNPAVYARVFTLGADAPTFAGSIAVSSFQLGISLTPFLAAASLTRGGSFNAVCLTGAGMALLCLPLIATDRRFAMVQPA